MADRGRLIDGKALAKRLRAQVAEEVRAFVAETGRPPGLATVLVGDDPASAVYVRNKRRACERTGIRSYHHHLPGTCQNEDLLSLIEQLNAKPEVHGILVQLPLPEQLDTHAILDAVSPAKDVDGFHPVNLGRLVSGRPGLRPCTPLGITYMLDEIGYACAGKRAVVIGRSTIVGKPMALLLLERHATVTVAHSRTRDLPALCREADLLVAAVGRPKLVEGSWVKEGAVVIDVGINRVEDGTLVGDVDFEAARARAAYITPVPGGVGPMTIATLLANTLEAARAQVASRGGPT
ncbi:MAG: bifunctional methylenetetrahydrofolate dehydrogenase/methenyltetrahydrofolate cyclohydrolase FolD [Deltaproteobacteria bacterium]|nr:MAG: bifunctional methylenetetrahydrofolate dehydrogenase/methenyltetrahydrofolate cyclohydrolase FolD [Deltaproteobacteria bacterium]